MITTCFGIAYDDGELLAHTDSSTEDLAWSYACIDDEEEKEYEIENLGACVVRVEVYYD